MSTSTEGVYLELKVSHNTDGYENTRLEKSKTETEEDREYDEVRLSGSLVNESDDYDALNVSSRTNENESVDYDTLRTTGENKTRNTNEGNQNTSTYGGNSNDPQSKISQNEHLRFTSLMCNDRKWKILFVISLVICFVLTCALVLVSVLKNMDEHDEGNPCDSSPCYNNGTCIVNNSNFTCVCPCGYLGNQCQDSRCEASDHFNCVLIQDRFDDFDWYYHSGHTSSGSTGPSSAFDGDYYYYFETSNPVWTGSKARLIAEIVNLDSENCLQFHYHMYGSDIGALVIYNGLAQIWRQSGNHGNIWHAATITFNKPVSTDTQIKFEAIRGSGYQGDIAIDNIIIKSSKCP